MKEAFLAAKGYWIGWAAMSALSMICMFNGNRLGGYCFATGAAVLGWIGFGIWLREK